MSAGHQVKKKTLFCHTTYTIMCTQWQVRVSMHDVTILVRPRSDRFRSAVAKVDILYSFKLCYIATNTTMDLSKVISYIKSMWCHYIRRLLAINWLLSFNYYLYLKVIATQFLNRLSYRDTMYHVGYMLTISAWGAKDWYGQP